jgi:hypothetical protein
MSQPTNQLDLLYVSPDPSPDLSLDTHIHTQIHLHIHIHFYNIPSPSAKPRAGKVLPTRAVDWPSHGPRGSFQERWKSFGGICCFFPDSLIVESIQYDKTSTVYYIQYTTLKVITHTT